MKKITTNDVELVLEKIEHGLKSIKPIQDNETDNKKDYKFNQLQDALRIAWEESKQSLDKAIKEVTEFKGE